MRRSKFFWSVDCVRIVLEFIFKYKISHFWINLPFAFYIFAPGLFFLHETAKNHYFHCIDLSIGEINYFNKQINLHTLNNNIKSEKQYLASNTIENWFEHYFKWLNTTNSTFLNTTSKCKEILYDFKLTKLLHKFSLP